MYEVYRLVARIHPGRQRARLYGWLLLVSAAVLLVAGASSEEGITAGFGFLLGWVGLCGVLSVTDRWWARRASHRWSRTNPPGPWRVRVDGEGVTCAVAGRSTSYDWSAIA